MEVMRVTINSGKGEEDTHPCGMAPNSRSVRSTEPVLARSSTASPLRLVSMPRTPCTSSNGHYHVTEHPPSYLYRS